MTFISKKSVILWRQNWNSSFKPFPTAHRQQIIFWKFSGASHQATICVYLFTILDILDIFLIAQRGVFLTKFARTRQETAELIMRRAQLTQLFAQVCSRFKTKITLQKVTSLQLLTLNESAWRQAKQQFSVDIISPQHGLACTRIPTKPIFQRTYREVHNGCGNSKVRLHIIKSEQT